MSWVAWMALYALCAASTFAILWRIETREVRPVDAFELGMLSLWWPMLLVVLCVERALERFDG